jgi:clan AA aspartic protease
MIRGTVMLGRRAIAPLRLRGPGGVELVVDALIDTGFSSSLTLPAATITALGLAPQSTGTAHLADGKAVMFDVYEAEVEWVGGWRTILVWGIGSEVLLGMRLLADHQLRIEARPGGAVEITALP